jgi:hypothetical protein
MSDDDQPGGRIGPGISQIRVGVRGETRFGRFARIGTVPAIFRRDDAIPFAASGANQRISVAALDPLPWKTRSVGRPDCAARTSPDDERHRA